MALRTLSSSQGQAFGLVAACVVLVLSVFNQTFVEMVRIWQRSETFSHGYVVLPVFLYLVWLQRAELATLPIRPLLSVALLAAATGFIWLLGQLSSSLTPSFFAMIAFVPLVIVGILGWRWARSLMFPLALLLFAVPFGEAFVPMLMEWTADFTVLALRISGVPVYREGTYFVVPGGQWSVIDACSGIRYLIASMFVGALYAWHMYRSPWRRGVFFLASIVVPIVANWLRAYLIVMLAYVSDNRVAAGVDHFIYGWIFFGLVMFLLFGVGAIWRQDEVQETDRTSTRLLTPTCGFANARPKIVRAAVLMFATLMAWPLLAAVLMLPLTERPLHAEPIEPAVGWLPVSGDIVEWQPQLEGASSESRVSFEKEGRRVGVFRAVYRNQRQGAELVSSANRLLREADPQWRSLNVGTRSVHLNGRPLVVRTEEMRSADRTIFAWRWYWLGGASTSSDWRAKAELALDRLLRRDDTSAWIAVYVVAADASEANATLQAFVNDMGGSLEHSLRKVAGT